MASPAKDYKAIGRKVAKFIKNGLRPLQAATLAGISEKTYYRWKEEHEDFNNMLEAAETALEMKIAKSIQDIATQTKNPQALVAFAERRFSNRWSSKTINELTGPNGASVVFKVDASGGYLPPESVVSTTIPTVMAKVDSKPEPS